MSVKDIGEILCLDSGTLTPLLKKLEEKGYIVRRRDDNDERILVASVMEEGLALRDKAVNIPREIASCIPLQAKDANELARILNGLKKNLSANSE
ncbi:transcriptional regulator MarR family [methanogenic archaeon ISO4-H5]|nr:transcriptional regulator MarR family [methanogenic archaeon ISO4-H5]